MEYLNVNEFTTRPLSFTNTVATPSPTRTFAPRTFGQSGPKRFFRGTAPAELGLFR